MSRALRVGVLGGGQLGRMLALAGARIGIDVRCYDPSLDACAQGPAQLTVGEFTDHDALRRFAEGLDVVTCEFENVPAEALRAVADVTPTYPPASAFEVAQDRLAERTMFAELGIPTPAWRQIDTEQDLHAACAEIPRPTILKTRRLGYDGRGQASVGTAEDAPRAWAEIAGQPSLLDERVAFTHELSIVGVRGTDGSTAFYPLTQNVHTDGILRTSVAPAQSTEAVANAARDHATKIMNALGYVGVLAVEFFEAGSELIANEIAPRVHNTGHWTIEGAHTSQFENHLRAVLGLPIGSCDAITHAGMVNLVGSIPPMDELLAIPGARVHGYTKAERAGRKVGHVTFVGDVDEVREGMSAVERLAWR